MRRLIVLLSLYLIAGSAIAAEAPECVCVPKKPDKAIELIIGAPAGGPVGLLFFKEPMPGQAPRFTSITRLRMRLPARSSSAIELNFIPAHGAGANLVSDVVHIKDFRWHLVLLGAFWNVWSPMSATSVHRGLDVTFGTGMELPISKDLVATFDWRAFMANPLAKSKGDDPQANAKVEEALKGAQVWLGLSWRLPL